jgi:hypothetical protein
VLVVARRVGVRYCFGTGSINATGPGVGGTATPVRIVVDELISTTAAGWFGEFV